MPDIGTADVKPSGLRPSGFTSQQCQYLAYSPCCHAIAESVDSVAESVDVGIPEPQKVRKQGRDDHTKQ